jgi:predicted small metal-binding protein
VTAADRGTRERLAQGLPEHVEDEHLLDQIAEDLDEHLRELVADVDQEADGAGPRARRRNRAEVTTPPIGPAAQPKARSDGA